MQEYTNINCPISSVTMGIGPSLCIVAFTCHSQPTSILVQSTCATVLYLFVSAHFTAGQLLFLFLFPFASFFFFFFFPSPCPMLSVFLPPPAYTILSYTQQPLKSTKHVWKTQA